MAYHRRTTTQENPDGMDGRTERAPSMRDVAERAGVSAQTVSRTLSDHPYVRSDLRARVLAAVDELGYTRNFAAKALSSGRTGTIGVVNLVSLGFTRLEFLYGVERAAADAGYAVVTSSATDADATTIGQVLRTLIERGVDGVILAVPVAHDEPVLRTLLRRVPAIVVDDDSDGAALDQRAVGRIATTHLLDLGHRTVWHVAGPDDWSDGRERRLGWEEALRAAGAAVPPVLQGDWSPAAGYHAGLELARMPEVTAVFVANDEMAFGLLRAMAEVGRPVPATLSVVSCDDIPLARYASPPLTTIVQPFDRYGARAVRTLLRRIRSGTDADAEPAEAPELRVRGSSASPPSSACW